MRVRFLTAAAISVLSVSSGAQQPANSQPLRTRSPYAGWLAIANGPIPGFGGAVTSFTLAPDRSILNCVLNVMLTDTTTQAGAARNYFARPDADQGMAPPECGKVTNIKIRQGKYGIAQLLDWYDAIEKANTAYVGKSNLQQPQQFMAKRIDVRLNQIQIASPNPDLIARLRRISDSLSVPHDAIDFSDEDVRSVLAGLGVIPPRPTTPGTIYFEFQVDKAAAMLDGNMEKLVKLQKATVGVSGNALVQFVVDSSGKPDPATFKVLKTTDDRISAFLRRNIGSVVFTPAIRGGVAVPQLVQAAVHFE